MPNKADQACISMVGTRPLFVRENLEHLLDAFENDSKLKPSAWSLEERRSNPYSRADVLQRIAPSGDPLPQTYLYLRRKTSPTYGAMLPLSNRPITSIELPKPPPADYATAASFRDADLSGATLTGTTFDDCDFTNTRLVNASAKKAGFRNANLTNADFSGADLENTDFTGATLAGARFTGARLDGAHFDAGADPRHA
jgi:hypothetical protein